VSHFEQEVLRLLSDDHKRIVAIERLLKTPHLTLSQLGATMSIGSIAPGTSGQFGVVINFPSGVTAPAGYNPTLTFSSNDIGITFAPATVDASNGAIPLSQQVVATVPSTDTSTSAQIVATALGTDGVTPLTSNIVQFTIPQAPATEPTLVLSQLS
jgi:hypothetical protein